MTNISTYKLIFMVKKTKHTLYFNEFITNFADFIQITKI